jgi:redox-sensing transcriptional repressor
MVTPRNRIPRPAVKRLSLYLRELEARVEQDRPTISSRQLGEALGITDAQVRKDLAWFGQLGQPGVGYQVRDLAERLRRILRADRTWSVAVVGAGNIGRALMAYGRFRRKGFEIVAAFDGDPKVVGQTVAGLRIQAMADLSRTVRERAIEIGIVAVPADAAQAVTDRLIDAGVTGILNFAPVRLEVHDRVSIISVDFSVSLEQLAFQVSLGLKGSLE